MRWGVIFHSLISSEKTKKTCMVKMTIFGTPNNMVISCHVLLLFSYWYKGVYSINVGCNSFLFNVFIFWNVRNRSLNLWRIGTKFMTFVFPFSALGIIFNKDCSWGLIHHKSESLFLFLARLGIPAVPQKTWLFSWYLSGEIAYWNTVISLV